MIDQSDTWRFDMPNLPHKITRTIIDTRQMFRNNVRFKPARLGKKYVVLKKTDSEKYDKPKVFFFLFSSVINNASPIA